MVRTRKVANRFKELKDFIDDYIDFSEEPVAGLVPLGDTGLYKTPDEPANPQDCDRYPSSPFCGDNPFTLTPVGLEPEIIVGDCDIGVRLNLVLGFVKLPPVNLVYRKPECRIKNGSFSVPFVSPGGDYNVPVPLPTNFCNDSDRSVGLLYSKYNTIHWKRRYMLEDELLEVRINKTTELLQFDFPYIGSEIIIDSYNRDTMGTLYPEYRAPNGLKRIAYVKFKFTVSQVSSDSNDFDGSQIKELFIFPYGSTPIV